ncbi:BlaI/MecI/CopY family transcriptional regulator [Anaerolentibacter hominis]|uniref:BlaI/MecI/CopY family transcriptional regulator n=1 Tax=Anaerolentibacter hominis TaxID=3079009 RepID=UPI0031B83AF8
MKELRLHEGELNVMELLWSNKVLAARDIAKIIKEYIGWEKNTTYTVIKRLIEKGAVIREDPGFMCKAAVNKQAVQRIETDALISKMYNGSVENFIQQYLRFQDLSPAAILQLEQIISEQKF